MKCLLLLFAALQALPSLAADSIAVYSPDKKIQVTLRYGNELSYTVRYEDQLVLLPSLIDLTLDNGRKLSDNLGVRSRSVQSFAGVMEAPVPVKRKEIPDRYNQLTLTFRQPYTLLVRVYNDGVAYRLVTRFADSIRIRHELAQFRFHPGTTAWYPLMGARKDADRFHTSFEELYPRKIIDSLTDAHLAYSPVLVGGEEGVKVAITESDLEDYPGLFLSGTGSAALQGVFAPFPLEEQTVGGEFPQPIVTRRAAYIARTKGSRSLPWRVLLIAADDRDLPSSDLVYRLAPPSRVKDVSWIQPGQGTDEWIIGINLFQVPFRAGLNTATYKYYIDFARRFGFERIMMDAGWSDNRNLMAINPDINMDTISAYARKNGVKLSMWTLSSTLDRQLDSALAQFNRWGVDFIMTDFMDRDDQKMVNFYHRVARACADHRIMLMFHGAYPPKGLNRTWPNVMTHEGVLGSEYNIWSSKPDPEHDLILPFTRMLAGPMDYEPGLLDNATKAQFRSIEKKVMSQGTRCHQLAMFVVYDSPVQFFSGNPAQGWMEPGFMELLGSIPTVWDETLVLRARVSDYIITARRKGADWFIAGMTDWTPRSFDLPLDFLKGHRYEAVLCTDGINADNYPADYRLQHFRLQGGQSLPVQLAPGGGFLLKLSPAEK